MNTTWKLGRNQSHGLALVQGINEEMHRLMSHIVQLTEMANLFHDEPGGKALTTLLTMGRNEIQHQLLAVPTSQYDVTAFAFDDTNTTAPSDSSALTELTRLAASIYSDMVLFPLPWNSGVKPRLAKRMRLIWQLSQICQLAKDSHYLYTELSIWILWFGCFAAFRSRQQQWFELELTRVLQAFYGEWWESLTFATVKQSLRGFLWWDPVCDLPGKDLWLRLRSQGDLYRQALDHVSNRDEPSV